MQIKKRVGIITMHKVPNFGSALQAYALQQKVDSLGCDAEIIDYYYPNEYHCKKQGLNLCKTHKPDKHERRLALDLFAFLYIIPNIPSESSLNL